MHLDVGHINIASKFSTSAPLDTNFQKHVIDRPKDSLFYAFVYNEAHYRQAWSLFSNPKESYNQQR